KWNQLMPQSPLDFEFSSFSRNATMPGKEMNLLQLSCDKPPQLKILQILGIIKPIDLDQSIDGSRRIFTTPWICLWEMIYACEWTPGNTQNRPKVWVSPG
ncbi:hypothetical protein HGM15179_016918, partial [Zosterops borbonicus]